jgi:asparagine synthase (glutamine-hydrolysing)
MCGLTGFWQPDAGSFDASRANVIAGTMASRLAVRGPDDFGIWSDPTDGPTLAHRRLSILDLSPAGHQPMASTSSRYTVVFNGEIYNHLTLRKELDSCGDSRIWRGHSDTETLLAGFETWGLEKTLQRCTGMFAIALWDRAESCLYFMRDRLGEKPLYYGWAGPVLVFGSQLKALRAHPSWHGEVDRDALTLLFRHSGIPAPYSIYKNVWKLPPATILKISSNDLQAHRLAAPEPYWSAQAAAATARAVTYNGNDAEARAELEQRISEAIGLQQLADVPLGAFLSGGVDSSVIVALMQAQNSHPIRTFTIGFREKDYNEAQFAVAVARHLRTEHTELYVTPEQARAVIPLLPEIYDEPFSDPSQIPTFLVSQLARRHVAVSLSGDGGDELFGGYNRHFLGGDLHRKLNRIPLGVRRSVVNWVSTLAPAQLQQLLRPLGMLIPQLKFSQGSDKVYKALEVLALSRDTDVYRRLVSHWDAPEMLVIGGCEPRTVLDQLIGRREEESNFEQWMMTTDMQTYLPDDILVKLDRAAMAVSLETRAPFLDHRLVEFSLSLPLNMKIRNGQGKWLLRQVLYKYVPRELIERPKMGFGIPIDSWLRGPLREWAEELLDEARLRREGFLHPEPIRKKWNEHLSGTRNWQYHLWDVLMFQAWLEGEMA